MEYLSSFTGSLSTFILRYPQSPPSPFKVDIICYLLNTFLHPKLDPKLSIYLNPSFLYLPVVRPFRCQSESKEIFRIDTNGKYSGFRSLVTTLSLTSGYRGHKKRVNGDL